MLFILLGADHSCNLGRVDHTSLSRPVLMEMAIRGSTNKEKVCPGPSAPSFVDGWRGLTLNENLEVTEIEWIDDGLEGTIDLQWLPSTVHKIVIYRNRLMGCIDLGALPAPTKEFNASQNNFSGEIDLCHLPRTMAILDIADNSLTGTLSLQHLPSTLQDLYLRNNRFLEPSISVISQTPWNRSLYAIIRSAVQST